MPATASGIAAHVAAFSRAGQHARPSKRHAQVAVQFAAAIDHPPFRTERELFATEAAQFREEALISRDAECPGMKPRSQGTPQFHVAVDAGDETLRDQTQPSIAANGWQYGSGFCAFIHADRF